MTTFVLIPGAGGHGAYWDRLVPALAARGHGAVAVDIREDDPSLGLRGWADVVDAAIGDHDDVVLVAQSLGGFTAPMARKRDVVQMVVLLNAMVPLPGECFDDWWAATGSGEAMHAAAESGGYTTEFDLDTYFLHDVPAAAKTALLAGEERGVADAIGRQPCEFDTWPDVPVKVVVGRDDRFFPAEFQVTVATERLAGVIDPDADIDLVPGGHLVALSRPDELADLLSGYVRDAVPFGLADAAAELRRVADGVQDAQLDEPTPCAEWTVRDLALHVCGLTKAFTHAARHEAAAMPPEGAAAMPPEGAALAADWREQLARDLDGLVAAWRDPSAWVGEAEAGGVTMPAADMAVVALDELVLHGWDLARATGQDFRAADADVRICTGFAAAMSTPETLDSRVGLYGPLVETPADADPFRALLGLAGRGDAG